MYNKNMIPVLFTVVETPEFLASAGAFWNEEQREEFVDFIARNPLAGDVIPGAQGVRKVRWAAKGRGKRGGARVIYFNQTDDGLVVLLAAYAKNEAEDLPRKTVKRLKNEAQ